MLRMRYFRMELKSINRSRPMFDGGQWTGGRVHERHELSAGVLNLITMAHPDGHRLW